MTLWLIIGSVVIGVPVVATCIWLWKSRDKAVSARHAAPRNFRPEDATVVTLPLRLPEVPLHRDVVAATFGRGHLFADLNQAHAAYWRRQAPDAVDDLVAKFEPPLFDDWAAKAPPCRTCGDVHIPDAAPNGCNRVIPARVVAALTRAGSEDTVVTSHDLEPMVGFALFDAEESVDEYVERLFAGIKVTA